MSTGNVTLGFTFLTLLKHEELFNARLVINDEITNNLRILYSAIVSTDKSYKKTFDEFCTELTIEDQRLLNEAIGELMAEFYNIPEMFASSVDGSTEEKEGANP